MTYTALLAGLYMMYLYFMDRDKLSQETTNWINVSYTGMAGFFMSNFNDIFSVVDMTVKMLTNVGSLGITFFALVQSIRMFNKNSEKEKSKENDK